MVVRPFAEIQYGKLTSLVASELGIAGQVLASFISATEREESAIKVSLRHLLETLFGETADTDSSTEGSPLNSVSYCLIMPVQR